MEKAKISIAAIGGSLAAWWGDSWVAIIFVVGAILFDYITGITAAGREHDIDSRKGTDGLYKKFGLFLLMVLGFGLDAALTYFAANGLGVDLPFNMPLGLIICAWIIINEVISILENFVRLGVPIPAWLTKLLKITKDRLDNNESDGSK